MSALQGSYLDNDINQGNLLQADFLNPLFCVEFTQSILETYVDYSLTGELFEVTNLQFENAGCSVSFNYREMDIENITLLELPVRVWVFGFIDDNNRPILAKLNEEIQKSNASLNVLYVKAFRAKSIDSNTFASLLDNQKIFLKYQFKMQNKIGVSIDYRNTNDAEVPF